MNIKRFIALLLCSNIALFVFSACGNSNSSSSEVIGEAEIDNFNSNENESNSVVTDNYRSLDEIKASGELVMLTSTVFEPFEYVSGGKVVGVDVDLARMIADEIGVGLKVVDMHMNTDFDFDLLVEALKSGKGDFIASGTAVRPERKEQVDFSSPYAMNPFLSSYPRAVK
jgi:polar amino acid transport system substrate-binding protein